MRYFYDQGSKDAFDALLYSFIKTSENQAQKTRCDNCCSVVDSDYICPSCGCINEMPEEVKEDYVKSLSNM